MIQQQLHLHPDGTGGRTPIGHPQRDRRIAGPRGHPRCGYRDMSRSRPGAKEQHRRGDPDDACKLSRKCSHRLGSFTSGDPTTVRMIQ